MKKNLFLFTLLIISFLSLDGQEVSKAEMRFKPANLEEAVMHLNKILPDSTQQNILSMTEKEFLINSHFGLGSWIRNNWGLWQGGKIARYFNAKGVFHPDDMSGIILTCYYRQLHNHDWELDKQIKYYQDYWKESQEHQLRLESDTLYARQEKSKYESLIRAENENIKREFPIGTKVKVWVDYSDFALRTQIIGNVVDYRVTISQKGYLGTSRKGPKIETERLEAKVKIIEYLDIKKKKRIKRYNKMENDELWVSVGLMSKIEE